MRYLFLYLTLLNMFVFPMQTQATEANIRYTNLDDCYPHGSLIGTLFLEIHVPLDDVYHLTHAVSFEGGNAVVTPVFDGSLVKGESFTASIQGGTAILTGSYTLIGTLYDSAHEIIAQTTRTILVAETCPLFPESPSTLSHILVSQTYEHTRTSNGTRLLDVDIAVTNHGQGSGDHKAQLFYNPNELSLLNGLPYGEHDWISYHMNGEVEITFGTIAPQERRIFRLRFLSNDVGTTLRLYNHDYSDVGNPIFWHPQTPTTGVLQLNHQRHETTVTIQGRCTNQENH